MSSSLIPLLSISLLCRKSKSDTYTIIQAHWAMALSFLIIGILGRGFILVSSPLNICKEKCKCSVSRLTNYTSLLLRRLSGSYPNSNDPNHFDCKDAIHVPEGHAVVNSKISCKIWGINNVRRITVLLIHR